MDLALDDAIGLLFKIEQRQFEGDDEACHVIEDDLYHRVVLALASMTNNENFTYFDLAELVECAKIAIKTETMTFARRCA